MMMPLMANLTRSIKRTVMMKSNMDIVGPGGEHHMNIGVLVR
jgi:hypothetical protein